MHAYRTHTCGQLRAGDVGNTVRISGWVHRKRDHGGLLFVDLRDHYGLTQCVITPSNPNFGRLERIRVESVITVTGEVLAREGATVNAGLPVNSLQELIAYSKTQPKGVSFGTGGTGSSNHMAGEALRVNGANIVHVPYNNVAQAITDVLAGHIPMLIYTVAVVPHVRSGKLKALAVTSEKRHAQAPDVPTVVEQGVPGGVAQGWSGLFGPAGLPVPMRDKLFVALKEAMADPDIIKAYVAGGQEEGLMGPEEFRAFLEKDVAKWKDVVTRAKLPTE